MRRLLKWIGKAVLFLAIGLCLAPFVVPPFLDRIYYEGPRSDHYDGERFFNPGFPPGPPASRRGFFGRWTSGERAEWPDHVPVSQTVPPPRVEGQEMVVTWIGHATVLVQTQGLNILTDPVWSERTSPFGFIGPSRVRAPGVAFDALPRIDLVVVSHNHYDHMDTQTLGRLWERDRPLIVTSLGNDAILRGAGIESRALDWGGSVAVRPGVEVVVERVHHWSSRWGTDRNRALWSGFTVRLPGGNIFFAGDTGWGDGSWVREAAAHGAFRLAILPIGAYEPRDFMRHSHIDPEEAVRIFEMLDPTVALGMHWGTVQLTFEPIHEPPRRLAELRRERGIADGRFVATEVGASFRVPLRAPAR
ncbi:MBL fold metallo-hydrolase [Allosphingosinicella sp.]|jgi:L-ascorbate metabolism protein UlaG (beta-lactamase superfamily)|uniref:MBL fold metallo-hydrolase n=1 Tax=Allosphingosinicella sp. TaxID=2823234 RepID=UPI002F09933A